MKKSPFIFPLWNVYFSIKEQCFLFGLVLLGLAARIINALSIPLWMDETSIIFSVRDNSLLDLITQNHWDTAHPPLYFIFLHLWQMISIQPIWLRFPSLVASFCILYLIPVLAIKITNKYKFFPFIFLFLFSFSHTQISLNMVVRPYPFVILFMIVSLLLFFNMLDKKPRDNKPMTAFIFTNLVMLYTDYSAIWLFCTYAVFFSIYYLFYKKDKARTVYIFKSLFFSALCSLTILPLLLGNLKQSLKLEGYVEPIRYDKKNLLQGKTLYIHIQRQKKIINMYDEQLHLLDTSTIPSDPFPNNRVYVGYELSSLSILSIRNYSVCAINQKYSDINILENRCNFNNFISPLSHNLTSLYPPNILNTSIGKGLLIVDILTNDRESYLYKKNVSLKDGDDVVIKMNFYSFYLQSPSGLTIFGKIQSNGSLDWWKDITKLTVFPSGDKYRITYMDGSSPYAQIIFGDTSLLEKLSGSLYFFSGFPEMFGGYFFLLLIVCLMVCTQAVLLYTAYRNKRYQPLLLFLLYCCPIVCSLLISYFYITIFLGRNLILVNIALLCSLSLSTSILFSNGKKMWRYLIGILILIFFLMLFFIQFPYLHYVNPPYDAKKIVYHINQGKKPHTQVFMVNESLHFSLIKYYLLLLQNNKYMNVISLLDYRKQNDNSLRGSPLTKKNTDVYFLQFGFGKKINNFMFNELSSSFRCRLKEEKIDYVYFAKCE